MPVRIACGLPATPTCACRPSSMTQPRYPGAIRGSRTQWNVGVVVPDVQGRIPVAGYLQEFAGLEPARVLVRGANRTVELWQPERWERTEALVDLELLGYQGAA